MALPLMLVLVTGVFDFGLAFQRTRSSPTQHERARVSARSAPATSKGTFKRVLTRTCVAAGLPGGCPPERVSVDRGATLSVAGQSISAVK